MSNRAPTGVMIIAVLHFIAGLPWLVLGLYLLMAAGDASKAPFGLGELGKYLAVAGLVATLIGAAYFATAWGLYNLRHWSQAAAITVAGLTLVGLLAGLMSLPSGFNTVGGPTVVYAAVALLMIYYLMTPEVKAVFEQGGGPGPDDDRPGAGGRFDDIYVEPTYIDDDERRGSPRAKTTVYGPSQAPIMAWLSVRMGPGAGNSWPLDGDVEIGRDRGCQVRLEDDHVSRRHARIKLESGQFFIYDLGSSAGVLIQNRPIQRRLLYDGTLIRLGETTLEFKRLGHRR